MTLFFTSFCGLTAESFLYEAVDPAIKSQGDVAFLEMA